MAPLAFVASQVIEAIAEGAAPGDLTVTRLAKTARDKQPVSCANEPVSNLA